MSDTRILTPYEKNELRKYDIPESLLTETEAPVEYITHHVSFFDLDFFVDETVLIPRIETEELVKKAIQTAKYLYSEKKEPLVITDIGTGSGAIAISLAHSLKKLTIPFQLYATDVSSDAIQVAKKNFQHLLRNSEITFLTSNLLEAFLTNPTYPSQIDLIVSNLPYIPSERIPNLDKSVVQYEPKLALDGGESGLTLIHKLIKQAKQITNSGSQILLEVDYTHKYSDFSDHIRFWNIEIDTSHDGVRFVKLTRKDEHE